MAHLHDVRDSDALFIINPVTREIVNPSQKIKLIQYDHNSERFTFEVPRYIEDHDVSQCSKIEVHFLNVSGDKQHQHADVYTVNDVQVSPDSEDVVIFSWLISGSATQYAGTLNFLIKFTCLTGTTIDYVWNTGIFSGISVGSGMNNGEVIVEEYSDILAEWEQKLNLYPAITPEDNGKILTAENGKAVWKRRGTIYDCTGTSERNPDYGHRFTYPLDNFPELVEGATYKVYYDGELYECVYEDKAKGTSYGERGETMWGLGNEWYLLPASGENTGEPFFVYVKETGPILFTRGDGEHTLTICETNIKAATSWNDLTDKPFGDESVTIGDTLTWDGTLSDAVEVPNGFKYQHVSDSVPTIDELIGGTVVVMDNGVEREDVISSEAIEQDGQIIFVAEAIIVATNDGATLDGVTIPKRGVYFLYASVDGLVVYNKSLHIPNYNFTKTEVHKIDKKFLPDCIHYYDSLSSVPADLPEGSFVAVPSEGGGGGGLPMVVISTPLSDDPEPITLTETEKAQLETALKSEFAIVSFHHSEDHVVPFNLICKRMTSEGDGVVALTANYYALNTYNNMYMYSLIVAISEGVCLAIRS